jgi:hypothetical protein
MMTTLQDRIAFTKLKEIIQTLYDTGRKYNLYAKGYQDDEDDGTACLRWRTGSRPINRNLDKGAIQHSSNIIGMVWWLVYSATSARSLVQICLSGFGSWTSF